LAKKEGGKEFDIKEASSSYFKQLETSKNAIFALDIDGKIILWSKGCELLFGFDKSEVTSLFPALMIPQSKQAEFYDIFLQKKDFDNIIFATEHIAKNGQIVKVRLHLSPIKDISRKICGYQGFYIKLADAPTSQKRTFDLIRHILLLELSKGEKTINQLSVKSGINWKTVEKHLVYLMGRKWVTEIFNSRFVRIFGITKQGIEHLAELKSRKALENVDKKDDKYYYSNHISNQIEVRKP